MSLLSSLLSAVGFAALCFGIAFLVIQVVDFHLKLLFEVRACKREIERLEILVKGMQAKAK